MQIFTIEKPEKLMFDLNDKSIIKVVTDQLFCRLKSRLVVSVLKEKYIQLELKQLIDY